ncbi:EH domain-containing protein 2 [Apteryx rowi]|uniref:EH domain-containing protein 2 n=1 Tax=Apteryx rowi TaxID=308060 RepID=UPI000E1E069F|nr:EH domain-containing protein 2 [Apteryx rowi]
MFSWMKKQEPKNPEVIRTVTEGLKELYKKKLLPVEEFYRFHDFHSPALEDADFDSKPMVLVVGQYSTGKTTFIRYLLEQDIPGSRIGPEPTTDSFVAVMHGDTEGITPGNALIVDPKKPFRKLNPFGNTFLNRFMCAHLPNQVLESISLIDTPGILSGAKQRVSRGYDFAAVLQWFAERVDLIILLFDAHKLEISDEFSEAIRALRGNEDKIRVVLNKADMVETQQLMRVYGALMWSLGKVFNTPEVLRVFIGSFWAEPLLVSDNRRLFELEEQDLFQDIQNLPRNSALRKLNDLIKRARLVRITGSVALLHLDNWLYCTWITSSIALLHPDTLLPGAPLTACPIPSPPFPPGAARRQELLLAHDFGKLRGPKGRMLEALEELLCRDAAALVPLLQHEELAAPEAAVHGGAFEGARRGPFAEGAAEREEEEEEEAAAAAGDEWVVTKDKPKYDEIFYTLAAADGKVSGRRARGWMLGSRLPSSVLGRIWQLSDVDGDGRLDHEEFALASHLIGAKLEGRGLPADLPRRLVPPSKRRHKGSAE